MLKTISDPLLTHYWVDDVLQVLAEPQCSGMASRLLISLYLVRYSGTGNSGEIKTA